MAALTRTLKFGLVNKISETANTQCIRTLVISSAACKPSSGNGKKSNGLNGPNTIPKHVEKINDSIKAKFSPHRTRDSTGARIDAKLNQATSNFTKGFFGGQGMKEANKLNTKSLPTDSHVDVYDATNSVSLSSVMQSTVPHPYNINGKKAPAHLNMPGGQWAQGDKYVSGDLHDHHSRNISRKYQGTSHSPLLLNTGHFSLFSPHDTTAFRWFGTNATRPRFCYLLHSHSNNCQRWCCFSSVTVKSLSLDAVNPVLNAWFKRDSILPRLLQMKRENCSRTVHTATGEKTNEPQQEEELKLTQKQRLRKAVKEYGSTVIVFHVAISLVSLGVCYLLVSSGVDMSGVIDKFGINLASLEQPSSTTQDSQMTHLETTVGESPLSTSDGGQKAITMAAGVGTFVLAYAVHKVFAPARIGITLAATPFIVRHLRKIGFLKPPS